MKKITIILFKILFLLSLLGIAASEVFPFAAFYIKFCKNSDVSMSVLGIILTWFFGTFGFSALSLTSWLVVKHCEEDEI